MIDKGRERRADYAARQREERRRRGIAEIPGFFPEELSKRVSRIAKSSGKSQQIVIPALVQVALDFAAQHATGDPNQLFAVYVGGEQIVIDLCSGDGAAPDRQLRSA